MVSNHGNVFKNNGRLCWSWRPPRQVLFANEWEDSNGQIYTARKHKLSVDRFYLMRCEKDKYIYFNFCRSSIFRGFLKYKTKLTYYSAEHRGNHIDVHIYWVSDFVLGEYFLFKISICNLAKWLVVHRCHRGFGQGATPSSLQHQQWKHSCRIWCTEIRYITICYHASFDIFTCSLNSCSTFE